MNRIFEMNKLIIFIKNPLKGKVKTRLAATIGDDNALEVYLKLIEYTLNLAKSLKVEVNLFFSDQIISEYPFSKKHIQEGSDLGDKIKNAFKKCFDEGGSNVVIIGTDCAELTKEIIEESFEKLNNHSVVIGPALDGGYYLLGMNQFYPEIFNQIEWSTSKVFDLTLAKIKNADISFDTLTTLRDIDTEEDLFTLKKLP